MSSDGKPDIIRVNGRDLKRLGATLTAYEAPSGAWIYIIRTPPTIPEYVMVWDREPAGGEPPSLTRLGLRYEGISDAEAIEEVSRIREGGWPRHPCLGPSCPCQTSQHGMYQRALPPPNGDVEFRAGDCFAFEEVVDILSRYDPVAVLYGEILAVLPDDEYRVRVWCQRETTSVVEVYQRSLLTHKLTRGQMDAACQAGWPAEVQWLQSLLGRGRS